MRGGVLSGVATQTTAGNTVREIFKGMYIKNLLGLPYDSNKLLTTNAGDDSIYIVTEDLIRPPNPNSPSKLVEILCKLACIDKDKQEHGLGWKLKPADGGTLFKVSTTYASFLSKDILYAANQTLISRQIPRIVMSALITNNLSKKLTPAEFNYSNTCNL